MQQLVIISGKGGTGKTIISASFATLAANKVMVDADVDAANLYLLLHPNIKETHSFSGGKKAVVDPAKCIQCGSCSNLRRSGIPSSASNAVPVPMSAGSMPLHKSGKMRL